MKPLLLKTVAVVLIYSLSSPCFPMFQDDPVLSKVMSEFEYVSEQGGNALEWDIDAWVGRDLYKVWLKTSGEVTDSEVEEANVELVYSRAVYTTWDQQFGIRRDFKPDSNVSNRSDSTENSNARDWLSFGYIGTAPYFIEVDARVFFGEESSTQLLVELEREIMLTQEWVLTPELDIIANGRSNPEFGEGSGLSEIEFSLRLGYERKGNRKFQPFMGIVGRQTFGGTKRFVKSEGNKSGSLEAMIGIHSWF